MGVDGVRAGHWSSAVAPVRLEVFSEVLGPEWLPPGQLFTQRA